MSASYTRLRNGAWGLRVQGETPVQGTRISVTKKDGSSKEETIYRIIWTGMDSNGQAVSLVALPWGGKSQGGTNYPAKIQKTPQRQPEALNAETDEEAKDWI